MPVCQAVDAAVSEEEIAEVVEDGQSHEQQQEGHADGLGAFQCLFAWLSTRDDFDEQEEYMATVECGDGQDVHEGEHERNEGREFPKAAPLPRGGEEAAYGTE